MTGGEKMETDNLLKLIEQIPEIKKQFKTEYFFVTKPAEKSAEQISYKTIHNDEKYLLWKAEIEAELENLPRSKIVKDIETLFLKMGKNFNDDAIFFQLEAKLKVLGKKLSEVATEGNTKDKNYKLFISHSSKDADYVEVFVGLLEVLGLRFEDIICSSVPPYCIPLGNKMYDWLVNEFQRSELHVVYIFSKDYYASTASLNEMGAAWAMKHKWTGILLPGFQFSQLDGCIDTTQVSIKLDDADIRTLKFRIGEFKNEIIKEFNLRSMSEAIWERHRDDFLDEIATIAEKRLRKNEEVVIPENQGNSSAIYQVSARFSQFINENKSEYSENSMISGDSAQKKTNVAKTQVGELTEDASSYFCRVTFSSLHGGSIFFYSPKSTKENIVHVNITEAFWNEFVILCKQILCVVFGKVSEKEILVKKKKPLGIYKCAPDDGYRYYDEEYRIDFDIKYIHSEDSEKYDSINIDCDDKFEISLFKKGEYVFRGTSEDTSLADYGIDELILYKKAIAMIKFVTRDHYCMISKKFRRDVYSDGSGGYVLDYFIDEP